MAKIITTRYEVAEHFRTPEEMAAYLRLWICMPAIRRPVMKKRVSSVGY